MVPLPNTKTISYKIAEKVWAMGGSDIAGKVWSIGGSDIAEKV